MTQTAHVAAREAVYQILREAFRLRLELRPKTLRSRAALLYERIYESLIPLQKVKGTPPPPHRPGYRNYLCAEHAGGRYQEPDFTPDA